METLPWIRKMLTGRQEATSAGPTLDYQCQRSKKASSWATTVTTKATNNTSEATSTMRTLMRLNILKAFSEPAIGSAAHKRSAKFIFLAATCAQLSNLLTLNNLENISKNCQLSKFGEGLYERLEAGTLGTRPAD